MSDGNVIVPLIAAILAALCAASYLFKSEAIRGAGRVVGGLSPIALGLYFTWWSTPALPTVAVLFSLAGVVTVVCGARKYMRR